MPRDLYTVLRLRRDADADEIRSAYRRLAQKYHPDMGAPSAERFVEISEAYEVLGDPERRRAYDLDRQRQRQRQRQSHARPSPGVEPLASRRRATATPRDPGADPLGLLDEILGDMAPGFFDAETRPRGRSELQVELILDRREATVGGRFPLHVPLRSCDARGGTGYLGMHRCPDCRGARIDYHAIEISIPPGVTHGENVRLRLDETGLPGVDLFVTIAVQR